MATKPLPLLTFMNEWSDLARRVLRIQGCDDCGQPCTHPSPCVRSAQRGPHPQPMSGRATVVGFTVNHQQWHPALRCRT
jgi:hypothetical protein